MPLFDFLKQKVQLDSNLDRIKKLAGIEDSVIEENNSITEIELREVAPPDMEDWIKANKKRFIDQYGKKRGMAILYATAWKMHNESIEESISYSLPKAEKLELASGRYHNLSNTDSLDLDLITKVANEYRLDPEDLESYLKNEKEEI